MRAPRRRAFDPDLADTVRGQQIDRRDEPGGGVGERGAGAFDAGGVDDADGELDLVRVDARNGCCHAEKRITAPLAPQGFTYENRYTLQPPFGPKGEISTAVSVVR